MAVICPVAETAAFSGSTDPIHNCPMLVTFRTNAYANITMFGDVAVSLLKLMGHSGTVPSAIRAEDVSQALERLKAAVARDKAAGGAPVKGLQDDDSEEPRVSLANRAFPLIELLEAAAKRKSDVMWDS